MGEILGSVVAVVLIGGLLLTLGAIVRFSIFSPRKTRGARGRLRRPSADGLERLCGFVPPDALLEFYRNSPFVEHFEFTLLDRSKQPPKEWHVGAFTPLTALDVGEQLKVSGVKGIPLATDLEKGQYYVARDGKVMLVSPDGPGGTVEVAPDVATFAKFELQEEQEEE